MTHSSLRTRMAPLALALFFCAGLAQAQYVWMAPNGTRHYSDQPPPPGTPASKILKSPGRPAPAQVQDGPPPSVNDVMGTQVPPGGAAAKKPPTLADREADYRKRAKDREQAEQKAQADAQAASARAEHCAQLAKSKAAYESGGRIADTAADGSKRILTDEERAAGAARASKGLADCR